jgi:hypothetical protein
MPQMKQFDLDVETLNLVTMRIESFPLALPFLNNDGLVEHVGSRSHSVSSRPNSSTNISDEINAAVALRTGNREILSLYRSQHFNSVVKTQQQKSNRQPAAGDLPS